MNGTDMTLRRATPDDAPAVVKLFDEAIAWFQQIGNTGQWGTQPFSERPDQLERVRSWCGEDGAWVAVDGSGRIAGFLALGPRQEYVPPVDEPELYVRVLIRSHALPVPGVGRRLLEFAEQEARRAGVPLLRVDCYRGGSGDLVRFYESCGYRRTAEFEVKGWPGQVLERRLAAA